MHLAPSDPARLLLGPKAPPETVKQFREKLGLNDPIYIQYFNWFKGVIRGDLGQSIVTKQPVLKRIAGRLPATLELTISALILTVVMAIPIGLISAVKQYSIIDNITTFLALFWVSMPFFWLGLVLILLFSVNLRWLPISGRGGMIFTVSGLAHLILPAFTLGAPQIALLMRLTRSSMLEVLNEDYVKTARSKGLREGTVLFKHAFRNGLISIVTLIGMRIPWLFGGAVVTETIFAWPGIGRLMVQAVFERDYPVVQGTVLIIAILVVLSNLFVDILYVYIDPRIKYD